MRRLAQSIDALPEKDELVLRLTQQIEQTRRTAAGDLYAICRDFVNSLNRLTVKQEVTIDPEDFPPGSFQQDGPNLFQIGVRGRILQISFSTTQELVSTEDFRVPYTLAGSVRAFNQDLLERKIVEEQMMFYTVEKNRKMWRFFDPRTYRSGAFDQEYLVSLLEQLI